MTMQKEGNTRHTGGHFILLGGHTGLGHLWPEHCPCAQLDTANVCVTDLEGQQCPPHTAPSQLSFKGHPKHLLHNPLTTPCWFLSLWRATSHPGCAALNPKLREGQLGVWTSVMPFHNSTERKSSSSPKYKRDLKIILKLNKTGDIKMST